MATTYKSVTPEAVIDKFQYALDNNWGYILNTHGELWTSEKQKKTTNEMAKKYGSQWIGHYVSDCSGLFYWAFKQLGSYMYHGSNTMWRSYCTSKGDLSKGKRTDGQTLKPGTAVFTDHSGDKSHVGLYIGNGWVIEASGTKSGVIKSKVSLEKWKCWGELKYVNYSGGSVDPQPEPENPYPTLRQGAKGDAVKKMQELLRKAGSALTVDGIFGSGTKAAVVAFQKKNGLEADGICGPKTWAKLLIYDGQTPEKAYTVTISGLTLDQVNKITAEYPQAVVQ